VEPSGAVAAAAVFEGLAGDRGPVVAVISGGNVSLEALASLQASR